MIDYHQRDIDDQCLDTCDKDPDYKTGKFDWKWWKEEKKIAFWLWVLVNVPLNLVKDHARKQLSTTRFGSKPIKIGAVLYF